MKNTYSHFFTLLSPYLCLFPTYISWPIIFGWWENKFGNKYFAVLLMHWCPLRLKSDLSFVRGFRSELRDRLMSKLVILTFSSPPHLPHVPSTQIYLSGHTRRYKVTCFLHAFGWSHAFVLWSQMFGWSRALFCLPSPSKVFQVTYLSLSQSCPCWASSCWTGTMSNGLSETDPSYCENYAVVPSFS